ncbi:hypothetical protein RHMOL_Rhmol02G0142800 [Rhododendron molle]|uniref:Uncharacterized protein n=1 Tax=Rhododendron molle TaxID=49168 RepID=A0ACC0PPP9_RHOML|nr:hypothetical protein RHMOL_Rhmol02G0142800 [Rhododendron molle]
MVIISLDTSCLSPHYGSCGKIETKKKSFDNIDIPPFVSARNIIAYAQEIVDAFKKLKNVKIESDSLVAVNLITKRNLGNLPQSVLINEAHFLLAQTNTMIGQIPPFG